MTKKKRNITIYLSTIISILIIILLVVTIPSIKNNNYNKKILNNIYKNTDIKNIKYLNKNNNYYIIQDDKNVIVLDLNYDIVSTLELNALYKSNLNLVYRRGNLYYEEVIKEKNSLIYKYYDVHNNEHIFDIKVGGI